MKKGGKEGGREGGGSLQVANTLLGDSFYKSYYPISGSILNFPSVVRITLPAFVFPAHRFTFP